jgi:cytochrome c-type biogenesis protein CcmE
VTVPSPEVPDTGLPQAIRRRRNPLPYLLALIALAGVLGYIVYGNLNKSLEFFVTPTEYSQDVGKYAGRTLRLGGLVKDERYDRSTLKLAFKVTDGGTTLPVEYQGALPDLFRANQGVVVRGQMTGGVFQAQELLVKHSEEYRPPTTPGDVKKMLQDTQ